MVDRAFERDILAISSSFVVGRNTRTQERRSFFDPRRDTEEGVVRFLFFSSFFFLRQQRSSFAEKLPRSKLDDKSS